VIAVVTSFLRRRRRCGQEQRMRAFSSSSRFVLLFLFVFLSITWMDVAVRAAQQATPPSSSATPTLQYVGSETCKTCHEEMFNKLQLTPHSNLLKEGKKVGAVEWHGCESCHGPGSAHVEGGGDVTKIISFKNLSVQDASTSS
jgi:hypothetical protein